MAKKARATGNKTGWNGYVYCNRISKAELADAEKAYTLAGSAINFIQECVEAGYTFTFKFDDSRGAVIAQLFGKSSKDNRGFALTSFSGSVSRSTALTLHKHYNHFDAGVWEYADPDAFG